MLILFSTSFQALCLITLEVGFSCQPSKLDSFFSAFVKYLRNDERKQQTVSSTVLSSLVRCYSPSFPACSHVFKIFTFSVNSTTKNGMFGPRSSGISTSKRVESNRFSALTSAQSKPNIYKFLGCQVPILRFSFYMQTAKNGAFWTGIWSYFANEQTSALEKRLVEREVMTNFYSQSLGRRGRVFANSTFSARFQPTWSLFMTTHCVFHKIEIITPLAYGIVVSIYWNLHRNFQFWPDPIFKSWFPVAFEFRSLPSTATYSVIKNFQNR